MGWIVRDAVIRLRNEYGYYRWNQWRVCIREIGCKLQWLPENSANKGLIAGNVIYIRRGLSPDETAEIAWHECAHYLLHAGTMRFWSSKPGGFSYLNRLEAQAHEFAYTFPVDAPKRMKDGFSCAERGPS